MKEIELKDGDYVFFDPFDTKAPSKGASLGRAEFTFCFKWNTRLKVPRLERVYIAHKQQRNIKYSYYINCYYDCYSIDSWSYKGIERPHIWLCGWCKAHKGP